MVRKAPKKKSKHTSKNVSTASSKSSPNTSKQSGSSKKTSPNKSKGPQVVSESIKKLRQRKNREKVEMAVAGKKSQITVGMLKRIKVLQNLVKDLIPKMPFCRVIREVMQTHGQFLIQKEAINGLQCATEYYLTQLFEDGNLCSAHARRVTLMPPDLRLVLRMRSRYDSVHISS